jgi:hypothetical protein
VIVVNCVQGSAEWQAARLGVVTASAVHRILTPTGKLSAQRRDYLHELVAEHALGRSVEEFEGSAWTERGHEFEGEASEFYRFVTSEEPRAVGFVYRDEGRLVGCSPDWLVGAPGAWRCGVEVKCPKASTHIGYLLGGELVAKYSPQVQFSLWVTGLPLWRFLSYYPGLPPLLVDVRPDADLHATFDEQIPKFLDEMLEARARIAQAMEAA